MLGLKRGTVFLEEHQSQWDIEAHNVIRDLWRILENTPRDIQHIGSTAIKKIHAKPIIDIVVGMNDKEDMKKYIEKLESENIIFRGEDVEGQLLFVKGNFENDTRTHHIHVVNWNDTAWNNYINFRDYLNCFPERAEAYDKLKCELAESYYDQRSIYTSKKQQLIDKLLEESSIWHSSLAEAISYDD